MSGPGTARGLDALPVLHVTLSAPADADCIGEAELGARVAERLGERASEEAGALQSVRVALVRAESGGWRAQLSVQESATGATRVRHISSASPSCHELDDALVLVLAALVGMARSDDGSSSEQAREPAPERARERPAPSVPASHVVSDAPAPRSTPVARARYPFRFAFAASATLTTGRLPDWSWGALAALNAEWRRLTLVVGALTFPSATRGLDAGAHARFTSLAGLVSVCGGLLQSTWLRIGVCGGASTGTLYARTDGLGQNGANWVFVSDAQLGLRATGPIARKVRWLLAISGALPLSRVRFSFDESSGERRVYQRVVPGVLLEAGGIFGGGS